MEQKQQTVLVVDDSPEILSVITGLLKEEHKVKVARSGAKALEIVNRSIPDLILLDITMPEMNGFEVIVALKKNPTTKDIPVIFLTALTEVEDETKGFTLGAVDYISKPFNPHIVKARVSTHLELIRQRRITEELLENILPKKVIIELKATGHSMPISFENVTIFFSDMVNFTNMSAGMSPELLIKELSTIFTTFDEIIENNRCERIKTIGDAYLAVCGLPNSDSNHAVNITHSALECLEYLKERNSLSKWNWEARIGVHSGSVVGGIVGTKKYVYDVFGDTVNTASRVETASEPMRLTVSDSTYQLIKDKFVTESRGVVNLKGKGLIPLYFVNGKKT